MNKEAEVTLYLDLLFPEPSCSAMMNRELRSLYDSGEVDHCDLASLKAVLVGFQERRRGDLLENVSM